jgi:TonB family protein
MNKKLTCALMITCALVFSGWLTPAQTPKPASEIPTVIQAVAPSTYPPIAIVARADGKLIVEVKINAGGKVVSTKVIQGHELLASTAASAAKRWQFAASNCSEERSAQLTFEFRIPVKQDDAQIAFNPPYGIIYAPMPPPMVNDTNY